jgi:hypothetical protein
MSAEAVHNDSHGRMLCLEDIIRMPPPPPSQLALHSQTKTHSHSLALSLLLCLFGAAEDARTCSRSRAKCVSSTLHLEYSLPPPAVPGVLPGVLGGLGSGGGGPSRPSVAPPVHVNLGAAAAVGARPPALPYPPPALRRDAAAAPADGQR